MLRFNGALRMVALTGLTVLASGAAQAALHQDDAMFVSPTEVVTAHADQDDVLVAQWNEKKIRGIVKEYTDAYAGDAPKATGKKKKDCKTITHSNPTVQKRMRQACKYQK